MADGMQEEQPITVTVGKDVRHVPEFRGFKAIRAGRLLARVTDEVEKLWEEADKFEEEYKRTHTVRVTREEAQIRGWHDMEFEAGKPYLEYPGLPSEGQVYLHVFKKAFELVEAELLQLLALVLAPNDELERAMDNEGAGGVDGYLEREGKRLLFDANLGQLVDIGFAARKLIEREFAGKGDDLAGLRNLLRGPSQSQADTTTTEDTTAGTPPEPEASTLVVATGETEEVAAPSTTPTTPAPETASENGSPPLSTSSPAPTDGPEETSSLAPPGESYAPTKTA